MQICVFMQIWGNSGSVLKLSSFLFSDPHNVSISGCIDANDTAVDEHTNCTLHCNATGGNPANVTSYQWEFQPKFGTEPTVSYTSNDAWLELNTVTYTDAGVYGCLVQNDGGLAFDTMTVNVRCKCRFDW